LACLKIAENIFARHNLPNLIGPTWSCSRSVRLKKTDLRSIRCLSTNVCQT